MTPVEFAAFWIVTISVIVFIFTLSDYMREVRSGLRRRTSRTLRQEGQGDMMSSPSSNFPFPILSGGLIGKFTQVLDSWGRRGFPLRLLPNPLFIQFIPGLHGGEIDQPRHQLPAIVIGNRQSSFPPLSHERSTGRWNGSYRISDISTPANLRRYAA